jgi:hypothetical protein
MFRYFYRCFDRFEKAETNRAFKVEVDKGTGKNNTMDIFEQVAEMKRQEGIEEGIEKGEQRASCVFVENLLKDSGFPAEKIASLANVSLEFVKEVKDKAGRSNRSSNKWIVKRVNYYRTCA